jgi:hypothetical protein
VAAALRHAPYVFGAETRDKLTANSRAPYSSTDFVSQALNDTGEGGYRVHFFKIASNIFQSRALYLSLPVPLAHIAVEIYSSGCTHSTATFCPSRDRIDFYGSRIRTLWFLITLSTVVILKSIPSSGMWRRIFWYTYWRFGGTYFLRLQSTLLAVYCLLSVPPSSTLKMEAVNCCQMSFRFYQTTGRHIQQCGHRRDNFQSHTITVYKGQDYKRGW